MSGANMFSALLGESGEDSASAGSSSSNKKNKRNKSKSKSSDNSNNDNKSNKSLSGTTLPDPLRVCPACTYKNKPGVAKCEICQNPLTTKPSEPSTDIGWETVNSKRDRDAGVGLDSELSKGDRARLAASVGNPERRDHANYMANFRTKLCTKRSCDPTTCFDAHRGQNIRRCPWGEGGTVRYQAILCNKRNCPQNDACIKAHCKEEQIFHPALYKTQPCEHTLNHNNVCRVYGVHCAKAHGAADQRPRLHYDLASADSPTAAMGAVTMGRDRDAIDYDFYMYHFKTAVCADHCGNPRSCPRYHSSKERRRSPLDYGYEPRACSAVRKGKKWLDAKSCPAGDNCRYAHTQYEQIYHPVKYKTELCDRENCNFGDLCSYAHSQDSLRKTGHVGDLSPMSSHGSSPLMGSGGSGSSPAISAAAAAARPAQTSASSFTATKTTSDTISYSASLMSNLKPKPPPTSASSFAGTAPPAISSPSQTTLDNSPSMSSVDGSNAPSLHDEIVHDSGGASNGLSVSGVPPIGHETHLSYGNNNHNNTNSNNNSNSSNGGMGGGRGQQGRGGGGPNYAAVAASAIEPQSPLSTSPLAPGGASPAYSATYSGLGGEGSPTSPGSAVSLGASPAGGYGTQPFGQQQQQHPHAQHHHQQQHGYGSGHHHQQQQHLGQGQQQPHQQHNYHQHQQLQHQQHHGHQQQPPQAYGGGAGGGGSAGYGQHQQHQQQHHGHGQQHHQQHQHYGGGQGGGYPGQQGYGDQQGGYAAAAGGGGGGGLGYGSNNNGGGGGGFAVPQPLGPGGSGSGSLMADPRFEPPPRHPSPNTAAAEMAASSAAHVLASNTTPPPGTSAGNGGGVGGSSGSGHMDYMGFSHSESGHGGSSPGGTSTSTHSPGGGGGGGMGGDQWMFNNMSTVWGVSKEEELLRSRLSLMNQIQDENALLSQEVKMLRQELATLREYLNRPLSCPSCGEDVQNSQYRF